MEVGTLWFGFQHLYWILSKKMPQWLVSTGKLNISPTPTELMLTSSPNVSEGVETCKGKKRHSKNSPNAKGQKLPKNLLWSLLLFKLQIFFSKKDILMLGWERTGKQQEQLGPEERTEDRMVHSLVCQGLDSSKDPTGIHVESWMLSNEERSSEENKNQTPNTESPVASFWVAL